MSFLIIVGEKQTKIFGKKDENRKFNLRFASDSDYLIPFLFLCVKNQTLFLDEGKKKNKI